MTTISKTISYGIVPFIRRKEEILVFLVKTKEKAKYGATKGKIRVDESVEECVLREVNEEIGVKIKKEDLGEFFYQENPSKDIGVYLVDWKKYQNKKIKLDKTELTSSDWFNIKHLPPIDKKQEQIFQDLKTSLKNLK